MLPKGIFKKANNVLEGVETYDMMTAPSVPDNLYLHCPACKAMLVRDELAESQYMCKRCGHHFRMSARQRIASLCDVGTFRELDAQMRSDNPLDFPAYQGKLHAAEAESGEREAVVTGWAQIGGVPCFLFVMEPGFMMGSMGRVVGEKITRAFEYAAEQRLPVVGCTVSGGARMQEGILSLMQMAKTSGAVKRHSDAGGLYIAVLTDPTTGGVTASFAMEADIILAEPGALIAFAGPRVIEQTIKQKLPQGFQRAEFLLENGFVDAIVPRASLRPMLVQLLTLHQEGRDSACKP